MTKYRDEVCRLGKCPNHPCNGLCPPLQYVNGRSQSKEVLLSNLMATDNLEFRDYKDTLSELAEDRETRDKRRKEKLEVMLSAPNTREKFIKLALMAGFTQNEVSIFFNSVFNDNSKRIRNHCLKI